MLPRSYKEYEAEISEQLGNIGRLGFKQQLEYLFLQANVLIKLVKTWKQHRLHGTQNLNVLFLASLFPYQGLYIGNL